MGRSTGTGAVSVWMHHLQNITWNPQFTSPHYAGPAFKVSAGVRGIDLVLEADKRGLVIVSGDCPVRSHSFAIRTSFAHSKHVR